MIQGFFQGSAAALFVVAANALFLIDHGSERLPWVYIVAAVIIPIMSFGYNSMAERISVGTLTLTTLLMIAALFFACWVVAVSSDATWVSFLLMVLFFFLASYIILIQNVQASLFFDVREMKQRAPQIMATALAGLVLFGFLTPALVALLGDVEHLLLLAAIVVVAMAGAARVLVVQHPEPFQARAPQDRLQATSATMVGLWQSPYIRQMFSYQFLSSMGTRLILFVFLALTARQYGDADSIATFIGGFNAASRLATIVVLLAVVRPLLLKVGMSFGLLSNPVLVTAAAVVVLLTAIVFPDQLTLLFWTAVIARGVDLVFTFSSTEASVRTAYQVFPERQRIAAITTIEGISIPLSTGLAGIALLVLDSIDAAGDKTVLTFIVIVCALWVAASWRAVNGYRETLIARLSKGHLDPIDITLDDSDTLDVATGLLASDRPATVSYVMDLLKRDGHPTYHEHAIALLERDEEIAVDAARRLEAKPDPLAYPALKTTLDTRPEPTVRAAVIGALVSTAPDRGAADVAAYFEDPDTVVRNAALAATLRHGDPSGSGAADARARLDQLASSNESDDQVSAAQIVTMTGDPTQCDIVLDLLNADDPLVIDRALVAASAVPNADLTDPLIAALDDPNQRSAAVDALIAQGNPSVTKISTAINADNTPPAAAVRLVRMLGEIDSGPAFAALINSLDHPNPEVRAAVIAAVGSARRSVSGDDRANVSAHLEAEVDHLTELQGLTAQLDQDESYGLVHDALMAQQAQARSNGFSLVGALFDPVIVERAVRDLNKVGPERALAVEAIETIVDPGHRGFVRQLSAPADGLDEEHRYPKSALRTIIESNHEPWTVACALAVADQELELSVVSATTSDNDLIKETAEAALRRFSGPPPDQTRSPSDLEAKPMLIIEKVALLKQASIFENTPDNVLAAVASIATEVHLLSGAELMRQGDTADDFFVVIDGELVATINGATIATMGPGEMVGELGIFNDEPRAADVTATSDAMLLSLHRGELTELMANRPEIAQGIIAALSRRLTQQGRR